MQYDEKMALMLYIHFGPHMQKKRLKCENCLDYEDDTCKGKGYKHKDVIKCMKDHSETAEFEYGER